MEIYLVYRIKHTAHPEEGIGWSDLPAYSRIGMSRFSVAKTYLVSMGGMGGGFLEPLASFLFGAPFLFFKREMV